jgi:hypothetical protein
MARHFFISYARQDYDVASRLKADLEQQGFSVWIDQERILSGIRWPGAIKKAIRESLVVLYLVSPASQASFVVEDELGLAAAYKRPILPVWVKGNAEWLDVVIIGYGSLQHIDLRGDSYASGFEKLVKDLRRHGIQTEVLPPPEGYDPASERIIDDKSVFANSLDKEAAMPVNAGKGMSVPRNKPRFPFSLQAIKDWFFPQTANIGHPEVTRNGQDQPVRILSHATRHNPYKGLRAFEYKDARDFFGRRDLVNSMIQQIKNIIVEKREDGQSSRCMLVVSASGAGKSSTVLAGLLPELQKDSEIVQVEQKQIAEVERWLFLDPVRPGDKPIAGLIQALNRPFLNAEKIGSSPLELQSPEELQEALAESPLGLYNLLQRITTKPREQLVLTIDQLEELFAPTVDKEQQMQFIELLVATATQLHSNVLVIATLRADFYDHILKDPHLFAIMKAHRMEVPPMSIQDLREVIEKPAEAKDVGVTFEPDLVGELLYEVRRRPDALPLLQFTLAKLFDQCKGEGRLTWSGYDDIGGIEGALDRHAEATYYSLPDDQHKESAKNLFTNFFINVAEIQNNTSHIEFAEGVTSRRVTRAELLLDDPNSQHIRDTTLEIFTNARLLIVRHALKPGQEQEDTTYEISHEVLIRAWKRLQQWIEEDLEDIYFLQRLRPRIQLWRREDDKTKQQDLLAIGHELEQFQQFPRLDELSHDEREYLEASQQWQKKLKRQSSIFFLARISLAVVVALVPVLLGVAYIWGFYAPSPTTVTSLRDGEQGSLRAVLGLAPAGATITFSPALRGQTIQLTDNLKLERNVTIQGFQDKTPIISSGQTGKGISIKENADVTFNSITFADSYTRRASLITNDGVLTFNNCLLTNNKSYGLGGGAIVNHNRLTLNNTTLTLNQTSGNGGAIRDLFGIVTVNNSRITENTAYNNGGGIYTQGGHIGLVGGEVSYNHAQLLYSKIMNNYGGGIDVVNGSLTMFSTDVFNNISAYYGGGIALQGSLATINNAKIHDNTAGVKGGGLIVTKDTDNNFSSLAVLSNIVVAGKPVAQYYIGQNAAGPDKHEDEVAGQQTSVGDTIQVADDDNVAIAGNPPPKRETPPEQTVNYLGVAHINEFCQNEDYSYGEIKNDPNMRDENGQDDIQVLCTLMVGNDRHTHKFFGKEVCRLWFAKTTDNATIVDRLTNYFDPSSLQCYKNLKLWGTLGEADFDAQCKKDPINEGLYNRWQERQTAYDWSCQPKDHDLLPIGLSVADACNIKYGLTNAIDRLVNYNSPYGWECWQPV